ncbi:MAG TPA: 2-oxoglutarate dehydrogenase E1 component [Terriglobia bacterium]|nr:2-oxoglutarate dehydrogenase E1 component [Terriglobia bacterium]
MDRWKEFQGVNLGWALELYERYLADPSSVDTETRRFFEQAPAPDGARPESTAAAATEAGVAKIVGAVNLAESIRKFGHMDARLDPLGSPPPGDPSLLLESHRVTEEDLRALPASLLAGAISEGAANFAEVIARLRRVYSSSVGYDFAHLRDPEERAWLQTAAESGLYRAPADPVDELELLARLTQVETFERFLHRTFPGKTRFSIEGLDMLVPVLDEVIGEAAEIGMRNALIGMAHRGRVNVLAHILHKPYAEILAEFKDPLRAKDYRDYRGWTGDVKYHLGARRAIKGGRQVELVVSMPPNPSHLEAAYPVVEGMARAAGTTVSRRGAPVFDPTRTLPILIHGDAAFAGQGVVPETLNLYRLKGYSTGGTIHIITDNQLGYTTGPNQYRSALYSTGIARGFRIPLAHVNADDPEACIEVARAAFAYRARFEKDFVISLVGYRRHGHNEGDEPSFTQPLLYQQIAAHPTVREIWAQKLAQRGKADSDLPERLVRENMEKLEAELHALQPENVRMSGSEPAAQPPAGAARKAQTAVPLDRLRALNQGLLKLPEGFALHRKLERARERRRAALNQPDERSIDFAMAEDLALASILEDGIAVRFTGQDSERGTFGQRHAVFHDTRTDALMIPLQELPQAKAAFEIHNSPLSENAAVGFEFGYSLQEPGRLVIWEAQYGDFINGAQTMIDEFVVSARAKWAQTPSLVLLLPHGHEGQGPDHSSGRPERFLQLAASTNLRLANCTTAAQYFHLLRLQATLLKVDPLPLIVLTPKSLLRHPMTASSPRELAEGAWQRVIDDPETGPRAADVNRLLLCSGKIYVDLVSAPQRAESLAVAIARVEQIYPFPEEDLTALFERYPNLREIVWTQEEPENMGACEFARPILDRLAQGRWRVGAITRPRSSSPAEGSAARHHLVQNEIICHAFDPEFEACPRDRVLVNMGHGETGG